MYIFPWFDWILRVFAGAFVGLLVVIVILYFSIGRKPDKPDKPKKVK